MKVLGVDASLTGTALCLPDGTLEKIKYPKGVEGDGRLEVLYERTLQACVDTDPDRAIVEQLPQHMSAAGVTGMAQGVVRLALLHARVPYYLPPPATVKKFATGGGAAKKPDMRMALYQRTGLDVADDDKVDAWWLRALGMHLLGDPLLVLPAKHTENLAKLQIPESWLEGTDARI